MKKSKLFILLAIVAVAIISVAFNNTKSSYSYLAIRTYHDDMDEVYISIGGKEYKRLNLRKQLQGNFDINPLINLINQYEIEGWEMQSIASTAGTSFVWMRKEK